MRNSLHPFIPVLVHQIVDDNTTGLRQIGMNIRGTLSVFHIGYQQHFSFIGREAEITDIPFTVGETGTGGTIVFHRPQLHTAAFVTQKGDVFAVAHPFGRDFLVGCFSDLLFP